MYCGQCGTPNHDEAGHCETCGAPLLITTGSRTCSTCGASLGDHDRFCTTCGTAATEAVDPGSASSYDAADDFGEIDIDDIQLDELPDWLQEMAPSAQETTPEPSSQHQTPSQPAPGDLPDWLRDDPARDSSASPSLGAAQTPPPADPGPISHQPANEFSLVSDEDLPDWLKALSDDDDISEPEPVQPSGPPQRASNTPPQPTRAVANLFEVPAVSRAWLTQGRMVDQEQVTSARQEFSPLEALSSVSTEQAGQQNIWESESPEPSDDEETRPFAVAHEEPESESTGRGQLIVRIVILALVVIVVLLLAFVLIQGV